MRLYEYLMEKLNQEDDLAIDFNEYLRDSVMLWGDQYCENLDQDDELDKKEMRRNFLSFLGAGDIEEFFESWYMKESTKVVMEITENEAELFILKALSIYDDILDSFIEEIYQNAQKIQVQLKERYYQNYYQDEGELYSILQENRYDQQRS